MNCWGLWSARHKCKGLASLIIKRVDVCVYVTQGLEDLVCVCVRVRCVCGRVACAMCACGACVSYACVRVCVRTWASYALTPTSAATHSITGMFDTLPKLN